MTKSRWEAKINSKTLYFFSHSIYWRFEINNENQILISTAKIVGKALKITVGIQTHL